MAEAEDATAVVEAAGEERWPQPLPEEWKQSRAAKAEEWFQEQKEALHKCVQLSIHFYGKGSCAMVYTGARAGGGANTQTAAAHRLCAHDSRCGGALAGQHSVCGQ
jgi:hypothetical protein